MYRYVVNIYVVHTLVTAVFQTLRVCSELPVNRSLELKSKLNAVTV